MIPVLTLMTVSAAVILLVLLHLVQDESHCSYLHTCPEGDFICRSGDCVSSRFKCDGEVDCPGGEDENGCDFLSVFVSASRCEAKTNKIAPEPGESPTRKDETAECDPGMVMCADHTACFPKHWICDGEADCLDESDE
ncbi:Low-density lipoprotein receptor domain class A, partial [Ostertagia ostertagi]